MNIASVQSATVPTPTATNSAAAAGRHEEKISVRNLNFYYGNHKALKNVNVSLYTRMVTAFIGPSGCGKSTLLRILNRIYDLYPNQRAEGEVMLDQENILSADQDLNYLRARVGMVFQKPTPFPMSIYENIAFGVRLYERLPKSEIDGRVESALRRGALWEEVKDKLAASSSGCVSRERSRSGLRSSCSMSRARRSTPSRRRKSKSLSTNSRTTTRS